MTLPDTPENKWLNRITSSGVYSQIEAAQSAADRVPPLPATEQADLQRIRAILVAARARLDLVDPEVASEALLVELGASLANVHSALVQLADSQNVAYLANAMAPAETVINAVARLYTPATLDEAGRTITSFKQSVAGTKSQLVRQLDEATHEVDVTRQNALSELASLHAMLDDLKARVETVNVDAAAATAAASTRFAEGEADREARFTAQLASAASATAEAGQTQAEAFRRVVLDAEAALSAALTAAQEANTRIDTILGLVGEKGLVGEYAQSASRERKATLGWRIGAGILALVAVVVSVAAARAPTDGSWVHHYVPKIVISLLIGGAAAYCASVAADHRRAALKTERVGLQLAAVKPYLGDLGDSGIRDALLAVLATQIFSADPKDGELATTIDPTAGGQLAALLTRVLKEAMDRVK